MNSIPIPLVEQLYPISSWKARSIAFATIVLLHIVLLFVVFGTRTGVPVELRQVVNVVDIPIEPPPPEPTRVDPNWEAPSPPPPQVPAPEFTIEEAQIAAPTDNRSLAPVVPSAAVASDGQQSSGGGAGTGTAGEGNGSGDGAFAKCTNRVMPIYPANARNRGETGRVTFLVQLSERGKLTILDVARSSGSASLDAAGKDALRRWRCSPVMEGGRAVSVITKQEFDFSLEEPPKKRTP